MIKVLSLSEDNCFKKILEILSQPAGTDCYFSGWKLLTKCFHLCFVCACQLLTQAKRVWLWKNEFNLLPTNKHLGRERKKKTQTKKRQKLCIPSPHPAIPLSPGSGLLLNTQLICPCSGNEGSWSAKLLRHSFILTLSPSSSGGSPTVYSPSAYGCSPPVAVFILTHKNLSSYCLPLLLRREIERASGCLSAT